jgi:hypothetical protein
MPGDPALGALERAQHALWRYWMGRIRCGDGPDDDRAVEDWREYRQAMDDLEYHDRKSGREAG